MMKNLNDSKRRTCMNSRRISLLAAAAVVLGMLWLAPGTLLSQHHHGGEPEEKGMQMMHSEEQMQQMMTQMAKDPQMLKHHLTMMLTHDEMKVAVTKLLKEDSEVRGIFEGLIADAKK